MPRSTNPIIYLNKWVEGPFRLSHHPLCDNFHDHTLHLFNRNLCRGCLFWYPGIIGGIILGLLLKIDLIDPYILVLPMLLLILPTLLQLVIHIPRAIKDVARLLLGLSTGFSIVLILLPGHYLWYVRIIVLSVFIVFYWPLNVKRNNKNESICTECPERPLRDTNSCSGFKVLRERELIANTVNIIGLRSFDEQPPVKSFDDI